MRGENGKVVISWKNTNKKREIYKPGVVDGEAHIGFNDRGEGERIVIFF
jgi:hypothetical protein